VLRDLQLQQVIQTYQSFGFPDSDILQQLQSQEPYASWIRELQAGDQLGLTVINQLVEDQLIRNAAAEQGVSVTQADIDRQVSEFFNYDPEALAEVTPEATAEGTEEPTATPTLTPTPFVSPTPSPTPTITPSPEFTPTASPSPFPTVPPEPTLTTSEQAEQYRTNRDEFFATLRRQAGLSDADINAFYETQALRDTLRDSLTSDITDIGPFVDARHILVNTLEEAQDVLAALQMGESFADLARAVSQDTGSGSSGGELGWNPVSQYVKPFGDAILASTELGELIGPIETEFGFHIIQVRAREDRELSETELESAKENAFAAWLEDYKTSKESVTETFSIWTNYLPDGPPTLFSQ
jgi:parvulin-like peptidyl-prolyl isomerase